MIESILIIVVAVLAFMAGKLTNGIHINLNHNYPPQPQPQLQQESEPENEEDYRELQNAFDAAVKDVMGSGK